MEDSSVPSPTEPTAEAPPKTPVDGHAAADDSSAGGDRSANGGGSGDTGNSGDSDGGAGGSGDSDGGGSGGGGGSSPPSEQIPTATVADIDTNVTKIGYTLAKIMLGLIGAIILVLFVAYFCIPKEPDLRRLSVDQALQLHKQWLEANTNAIGTLFEQLVTKALLPVLTAILGYIFGRQTSDS